MKHSISTRMICLILIASMIIPSMLSFVLPSTANASGSNSTDMIEEPTLKILVDGEESETLELYSYEKQEIQVTGVEADAYQWQIYAEDTDEGWVDIYGETSNVLMVSKALVGELLDENNKAELRCKVIVGDNEYVTKVFTVTIQSMQFSINDGFGNYATDAIDEENTENSEKPEFITITIEYKKWEYVLENDTYVLQLQGEAFSPYKATILNEYQEGDEVFEAHVQNPTIVGFDAYLGDATTPCNIVDIEVDLREVQEDVTYTVNYKPATDIPYKVHYFFQNIYDDLYVEDQSVAAEFKGTVGLPPQDGMRAEFDGFTNLFYQPDIIAADGSTIFEIYYERNYYLMEFDCEGGYGTNTIYVRHGTYVSVPEPVRTGYVFAGWDLVSTKDDESVEINYADDVKDTLPTEMPMYHSIYKAMWKTVETNYTIVYWAADLKQDGQPTTYSYYGQKSARCMSATELTPSVVGANNLMNADINKSEHEYFEYDEETTKEKNTVNGVADSKVIVEGDGSTIINVYYSRKVYEIRYIFARTNSNGGTVKIARSTGNGDWDNDRQINWGYDLGSLPTIKDEDKYSVKYETYNNYRYYYIAIRAEYGAEIEDIWPSAAMNNVGNYRWGSWAAEDGTGYRKVYGDAHANIVGAYPYMSADMIKSDYKNTKYTDENGETYYLAQRMTAWWATSSEGVQEHTYHIYFESLDGTGDKTYNGKNYTLEKSLEFTCAHNGNTRVDPFSYIGYNCINNTSGKNNDPQSNSKNFKDNSDCPDTDSRCGYCNVFYYDRLEYTLSYYNYNDSSNAPTTVKLKYGQRLSDPGKPEYPDGIEPGAYTFAGWYTTANFYEGTEVNWDDTMPASDLTLYAKWTPIIRKVNFYLLYTDVGTDNYWNKEEVSYPIEVEHGTVLGTTYNYVPVREDYIFVGWFYFDENGKKKFAPDSMAVVRDLNLFAEWKSTTPTTYEIRYEAWRQDGENFELKDAEIAAPLEGYSSAGKTVTYKAKASDQLYDKRREGGENYQINWFPEVSSHSILMDAESSNNVYTFRYFTKEYINYKVVYKNRVTGDILGQSEVKRTSNAIVTEKFKPFEGYLPEEYYIERAIAYDSTDYTKPGMSDYVTEENIIYFYYVPDITHAPYVIEHYKQIEPGDPNDLDNYVKVQTEQGIADVDSRITAIEKTFAGYSYEMGKVFTYKEDGTAKDSYNGTSGTVTSGGLEIKLYYTLNKYSYGVFYVEYGTETNIKEPEWYESYYGMEVTETAPVTFVEDDITYIYTAGISSTDEERTKSITIREYNDSNESSYIDNPSYEGDRNNYTNVITFYYNQKKITVYYHAVCKSGTLAELNKVSLGNETAANAEGLAGSTAMSATGFKFVGWYKDEECTEAVDKSWVSGTDGATLKPGKIEGDAEGEEHFYALFEPIYSSMEISNKSGSTAVDNNFIYQIQGVSGTSSQDINMTVVISGNETKMIDNLPIGDYIVTELTSWSWKYSNNNSRKIKVIEDEKAQVSFANTVKDIYWLGGEVLKINPYK